MISREEVQNLAQLARLTVTPAEADALGKDVSNILEYVGQVAAASAEAEDVLPKNRNILREDAPRAQGDVMAGKREALLSALPKREGDFNAVRKIIQKDE
ncbi:MAG TPA: Asp-tRNA(Asn)/Glu-tRNA(Gln) amidotransferase subunit GatC [Candidatus Paceibacterota bacterium]|nr:Asp-tRNA(Asn)/Glu-tRNA(Gln) amidotransferase subunit GatC [Candidatus Paceibacterota bacterium]